MDNLSAHKGERVRELIEQRGCELLYLPVYSRETLQSLLIIHDRTRPRSAATAEGQRPHGLRRIDLTFTEICIADSSRIHRLLVRLSPMTTKPPATASKGCQLGIEVIERCSYSLVAKVLLGPICGVMGKLGSRRE
jgi:hypothetical protein